MDEQVEKIKAALISFKELFEKYAKEINREEERPRRINALRNDLQIKLPPVSKYLIEILGDDGIQVGTTMLSYKRLLNSALLGGNNELPHNFSFFHSHITSLLNRAIGAIEAGIWPPKEPKPILTINDNDLRNRCADLLSAPNNYDRVIREATTVLENRIRNKCPHDILSRVLPNSSDQSGSTLVNKLFNPSNTILSISNKKINQAGFHSLLIGIFSYLRNPYHHSLDPSTEWSWAWSTVGFIDRLLVDIEECIVQE